jgi:hypothetical protein
MGHWWLRPLQATAKGAAITLGSTVVSCGLAIQVEKSANRLFFYAAPHWYADVEYAYGISEEQLRSVRHLRDPIVPAQAQAQAPLQTTNSGPAFSTDTQFVIPQTNGRADSGTATNSSSSSPKTKVVVIKVGDVMSNALTG